MSQKNRTGQKRPTNLAAMTKRTTFLTAQASPRHSTSSTTPSTLLLSVSSPWSRFSHSSRTCDAAMIRRA
jgi:hypothetical protein